MVRTTILTALVAASAMFVVACGTSEDSTKEPPPTATPRASVSILEPGPSTQVDPGQNVSIQYKAFDESGVGRVELWIDEELTDSDETPLGDEQTTYQGFLFWAAEDPGDHTIEMKAYDKDGVLRSTANQQIDVSDNPVVVNKPQALPASASSAGSGSSGSSRSSAGSIRVPSTTLSSQLSGSAGSPTIMYFRADVSEAAPGDTINLEWDAPGAIRGFLYYQGPDGDFEPPWEVYPKGTTPITIDPKAETEAIFTLSMINNAGAQVESTLMIPLTAQTAGQTGAVAGGPGGPEEWFFGNGPETPPSGSPQWSNGAQQHYEHGLMIWVEKLERIYVLYETDGPPRWEEHPDLWEEGMAKYDPDASPPRGARVPQRGFGLLFSSTPSVQEKLGWPWDDEVGAQTAVQSMDSDDGEVTYLKNLYSGVYRLAPDGTWEFLVEPEPTAAPPVTPTAPSSASDGPG